MKIDPIIFYIYAINNQLSQFWYLDALFHAKLSYKINILIFNKYGYYTYRIFYIWYIF